MTQILVVIREDAAYMASDSHWNCSDLGRESFVFRKVFHFGDHLIGSCGHGAGAQMLLAVRQDLPELAGAARHQEVGEALRNAWAEYAAMHTSKLAASHTPQSFFVLTRVPNGFKLTEWFGPPGDGVAAFTRDAAPPHLYCFGPLASEPTSLHASDIYERQARIYLAGVLKLGPLSGADASGHIDRAIRAAVTAARARGGWEAGALGLPMTGWRLPISGDANPIGDPEIGGLGPNPWMVLDALLGGQPSTSTGGT